MVAATQGALDDLYLGVAITDFAKGRNTEKDITDLDLNESPDCLNVKFRPGRLLGRNGFIQILNSLPSGADGTAAFFDSLGNRRQAVWSGGNLYQVTFGIATLVASAVYTAGKPVCHTSFNGKMIYSDGVVILRIWDPVAGTENQVPNTGGLGPPAAKVLSTYSGAIVAGATSYGGVFEPDNYRWSNVNDIGNWPALNVQGVGQGTGGEINSISNMGVSDQGVSPFKALFVGKSQNGIFGYNGQLGAQTEFLIPIDTGVLDGRTVSFIPGPGGRAGVVFLGVDRKVWFTNGIDAQELSGPIRTELANYILSRIQTVANPKFNAVRNSVDYHYVLDCGGGTHYCYDYQQDCWTLYQGWPSGYWTEGVDATGFPAIYVASDSAAVKSFNQANTGDTDNGALVNSYWTTPFLHAGNPEMFKDWDWLYCTFLTDVGQIEISANNGATANGVQLNASGIITTPQSGSGLFKLDSSLLDGPDVLAGPSGVGNLVYYEKKLRLRSPVAAYPGVSEKFRGSYVQVKFQQSLVRGHFELLGAKILYLKKGYKRTGAIAS